MYTTKPLSLFKRHPMAAASRTPPAEGSDSSYLVVKGAADDSEDERTARREPSAGETRVEQLPFPQNRVLRLVSIQTGTQGNTEINEDVVVFVPVPGQPLASNRYYAVVATGQHKGLVRACSHKEDMTMCCLC